MDTPKLTLQNAIIKDTKYWDVVKGIGILCIVLGHSFMPVQNFVYAFHVPLFFFVSGYLYSEDKYKDAPFDNMIRRLQSNWPKYVAIYIIYICLHNVFYDALLLNRGAYEYVASDFINMIGVSFFFGGNEFLISPLWFVPVLVESSVMLGFIVTLSRRLISSTAVRLFFQLMIIIILAVSGYIMASSEIVLFANLQIALMVMPYVWLGYLLRNYVSDITMYVKWYISLIAFATLIIYTHDNLLSLKDARIKAEMYIMALLGIYICLYLAIYIRRVGFLDKLFILLGRTSFFIMAFHFTIIRIIDRLYDECVRGVDFTTQEYLGHNAELIVIYLVIGIGIPILINKLYDLIRKGLHHARKA